jgi:hypothetical protein
MQSTIAELDRLRASLGAMTEEGLLESGDDPFSAHIEKQSLMMVGGE